MKEKIQKVLDIWHKHFENEDNQYSEYEDSDIEYFVSCMLYNHFKFDKALPTMQTIDLSYDFLSACEDEYDEIKSIIESINLELESEKIEFLADFIKQSQAKYSASELYLLNRMAYHINGVHTRYLEGITPTQVDFEKPAKKSSNPLDHI